MTHREYEQTFDWYWSDSYRSESARSQALKHRPKQTRTLARICEGDSLINFALWSSLPQGHPVGELWLETQTDLHAAIYLAYGGYFRQAFVVLRTWFELAIAGLYFANHYKQPNSRYRQWRAGNRQAPANISAISLSLAKRADTARSISPDQIRQRVEPVYAQLSHQVHGQGLDVYDLQNGRDNVPRFLARSFDLWWSAATRVFATICYLYGLFYTAELATYFRNSKPEIQRARSVARSLKSAVPEFSALVQAVVACG
ncbi:MAG: hypothetical protein ACRD22_16315 [Terriglobia bacterium]